MKKKHIKISTIVFMWFSIKIFSFGQINPNIPKPKAPIPVTNPSKHINEINEHRENLGTRSRLNDAIVELSLLGSIAEHWFTERTEMLGVIDHNKIILLKEGKQIGEFNLYNSEKDKGKIYSAGIPLADVVYGYDKSMSYEPILLFDQKGGYDVYEINQFDPENGWYSNPRFQYNEQSDCLFPG
ncbi:MAG TPA: hypothetical protein PKD85_16095, partial [Saprospiraceae bacterium]|nr:hypothetical protein [Saprospiraceae bacterium]